MPTNDQRRKLRPSSAPAGPTRCCSEIGAAAVVAVVLWLLDVAGVSGLSFGGLLILKAVYCGVLGFAVAPLTVAGR
jgi:hypothetical protein